MPNLSLNLYNHCRTTLLKCNEFDRDTSLRTVFITDDLYAFRNALPGANSKAERVDAVSDYLLEQRTSTGQPALPIFLRALRDRYMPGNALRGELDTLAQQVETALSQPVRSETPGTRGNDKTTSPSTQPTEIRARYALLIGVRDYLDPGYRPLPHTIPDVTELAKILTAAGYVLRLLHSDQRDDLLKPTRENIWGELESLAKTTGPGDLLLVHFGGHGDLIGNHAYLLPYNGRKASLARTAIDLDEFKQTFADAGAQARILLLDACHSGIGRDARGMDAAFEKHIYLEATGTAVLASCRQGEVAYEHHNSTHGAFTYYLLEGLRGAAMQPGNHFVSFDRLKDYVTNEVKKWAIGQGKQQWPNASTQLVGDPPLVEMSL